MSIIETRENIVNLLENIIKRSELMEKQSGGRNLLEIDLAMEDIRLLYREFELLRTLTRNNVSEAASEAPFVTQSIARPAPRPQPTQQSKEQAKVPPPSDIPVKPQEVIAEETCMSTNRSKGNENDHSCKLHSTNDLTKSFSNEKDETRDVSPVSAVEKPEPAPAPEPPAQKPEPAKETQPVSTHETPTPPAPVAEKQEIPQAGTSSEKPSPIPAQPRENGQKAPSAKVDNIQLVAEKFSSDSNSIYERLTRIKEDKSIGTRMQQKPISNIREAIGVNEKFIFVNELFNGDLKSYNESVEKLNSSQSIHQAFDYLNVLTTKFGWDGQRSADTIERFANLVQRRYMDNL